MSDAAALRAVPDQIRALRAFITEHTPRGTPAAACASMAGVWLIGAELLLEQMIEILPADSATRPPQQFHAPLADQFEPRVPRRSGHDPRLPAGRHHP